MAKSRNERDLVAYLGLKVKGVTEPNVLSTVAVDTIGAKVRFESAYFFDSK